MSTTNCSVVFFFLGGGLLNEFTMVGFEVFAAVVMKIAVFWDTAPCSPYMNRRFGGTSVHIRTTRRYIPEDGNFQVTLVFVTYSFQ
jgi:hypothetical protein